MDIDSLFSRREMFELTLRAAALPGAAVFFSEWLKAGQSHQHPENAVAPPQPDLLLNYQPQFFSAEDFPALQAFTEILIPTDEDPGAKEAYCASFIDFVLHASGDVPTTQTEWRHAMEVLKDTGFHTADATRKLELVGEMSRPERDAGAKHAAFSAYSLIKRQTTFAFYTSRAGMIQTLDYKGNSYNATFPACNHAEHQNV
jgi:hypothetical protein